MKNYFIRLKLNRRIKRSRKIIEKIENKNDADIFTLIFLGWILWPLWLFSGLFNSISSAERKTIIIHKRHIGRLEKLKEKYK